MSRNLKIRRALFTVSDKSGVVELAQAMAASGTEIVATGKTAQVLRDAGLVVRPIEELSGSPEAFQGRMKTLSFNVCSGILYRRGDAKDEADLVKLKILPIDSVVVNFYPFEKVVQDKPEASRHELVEEIDIGGPTLVRAAAKNAPDVLVLTDPSQYKDVIGELKANGSVSAECVHRCASRTWDRVLSYDQAIASKFGSPTDTESGAQALRYGENPHQSAHIELWPGATPIGWNAALTPNELSYNNILDFSAAYLLAGDLLQIAPDCSSVVIVKHNNPCGVASVPKGKNAQLRALELAWQGDPTSAFGGVLAFTEALTAEAAMFLSERFVEMIGAPGLKFNTPETTSLLAKRKKLKAVPIHSFGAYPEALFVSVPGATLRQSPDKVLNETLKCVTRLPFAAPEALSRFGIAIGRSLKSNAIALVRKLGDGSLQLLGAGQGQPNRIDALKVLAVPRALHLLKEEGLSAEASRAALADAIMISDAFFPFRDTVDSAFEVGIRKIIQPGGSLKDGESIQACDEKGVSMVFTGVRHFKH